MSDQANSIQEVLTVTGILQYAFLGQTFASKNDDGTVRHIYKTQLLLDPNSPDVQKIKDATRRVAVAAWEDEATLTLQRLAAQDKLALHDGNLQNDEAFKGKLFISTNCKKAPTVVVTMQGPALAAYLEKNKTQDWAQKLIQSGATVANVPIGVEHPCFPRSTDTAAVMVAVYAQSPKRKPIKYGPRINCQLMGVQFLSKGKGIGGGGRVARIDEFGINPSDADAQIPMSQQDVGAAGGLF